MHVHLHGFVPVLSTIVWLKWDGQVATAALSLIPGAIKSVWVFTYTSLPTARNVCSPSRSKKQSSEIGSTTLQYQTEVWLHKKSWLSCGFLWDQGKPIRLRNPVPKIETQDNEELTFPWSKKLRISVFVYTFQKPLPNSGQLHHPSYICLVAIWRLSSWIGMVVHQSFHPALELAEWMHDCPGLRGIPRNSPCQTHPLKTMKRQSTHKPCFWSCLSRWFWHQCRPLLSTEWLTQVHCGQLVDQNGLAVYSRALEQGEPLWAETKALRNLCTNLKNCSHNLNAPLRNLHRHSSFCCPKEAAKLRKKPVRQVGYKLLGVFQTWKAGK